MDIEVGKAGKNATEAVFEFTYQSILRCSERTATQFEVNFAVHMLALRLFDHWR